MVAVTSIVALILTFYPLTFTDLADVLWRSLRDSADGDLLHLLRLPLQRRLLKVAQHLRIGMEHRQIQVSMGECVLWGVRGDERRFVHVFAFTPCLIN